MKEILLILCIICFAFQVQGQTNQTVTRNFAFSAGAMHSRLIDEAFSHNQLKYTGTGFSVGMVYLRENENRFWRVALQGGMGTVSANENQFLADLFNFNVSLSFAPWRLDHSLFSLNNSLYIGGQLAASNYILRDLDVIEDATATFNYSANLYLHQIIELNARNQIRAEIALPLAGFIKRERYNGGINQQLESDYLDHPFSLLFRNATFRGVNPFSLAKANIQVIRQLDSATDLFIDYSFQRLFNHEIDPVRMYRNGLTIGLNFNF